MTIPDVAPTDAHHDMRADGHDKEEYIQNQRMCAAVGEDTCVWEHTDLGEPCHCNTEATT